MPTFRSAWKLASRLPLLMTAALPSLAANAPEAVQPSRILSVVTGDWNGDGGMDRALLIQNDAGADLVIYLSTGPDGAMEPSVYAPGFAWTGALFGTLPELRLTSNASALQVVSQNDAVGRDRWTNTITIVYRNGGFLLAGYTMETRDTLDPNAHTSCDVNLLTGKGVANGKAFKSTTKAAPVGQWTPDMKPQGCP